MLQFTLAPFRISTKRINGTSLGLYYDSDRTAIAIATTMMMMMMIRFKATTIPLHFVFIVRVERQKSVVTLKRKRLKRKLTCIRANGMATFEGKKKRKTME
jgi:hypothetical protein